MPTDWTLSAQGPTNLQGTTGDPAVTAVTVPAGTYALSEFGGPGGYTAGAWSCTAGTVTESSLVLPNGVSAICTINNNDQPARLTLEKIIDPADSGSGKVPADWTLTATPVNIPGQGAVSGNGDPTNPGGVNLVPVFAGTYTLSEDGPTGFDPGTWECEGGVVTDGDQVAVPSGGTVVCRITNTAVAPKLTLVKVVDHGDTGDTTPATAWTLAAGGPTPISGATGSATVTGATVQVGTYTLTESGPLGFDASTWSCPDAAGAIDDSVTLTEGQDITCTITNTAIPPELTLVKTVDNGDTGRTATSADWDLTAAGPVTITGVTDDPAITGATVTAGTYALSESNGPDGYTASDWTCTGADSSTDDSVTLAVGQNATCTVTNTALPAPTVTKTLVGAPVQNADGSWTIQYTVAATNPSTDLATSYSLTDTLQFGAGIVIGSAAVAGPDPVNPAWDGRADINVFDGTKILAAGATDNYMVTVTATVPSSVTSEQRDCVLQTGESGTGFLNSTTLTSGALTDTDTACGEPVSPTLVKDFVSSVQHQVDGVWDGTWDVTYTVTVANPSATTGLVYSLSDAPSFAAGVTINDGAVTGSDGTNPIDVAGSPFGGTTPWSIVTGRALPASGTDTYTVVVNAAVPTTIDPGVLDCTGSPGGGFFNTGTSTSGEDTFTDDACGPIPTPGSVWELTKLANPVSGSTVSAGSSIVYTLMADHETGPAISGATAVDDLSQVLSSGSVVQPLPAELSLSGTTLTWAVPHIPVGGSVSVSFTVLLRSDLADGTVVFNRAYPTSDGGHCTPCETTHTVSNPVVPPTPPVPPSPVPPTPLPNTGVPVGNQVGWAVGLLLAGAFLVLVGRRRRSAAPNDEPGGGG